MHLKSGDVFYYVGQFDQQTIIVHSTAIMIYYIF